MLRTLSVHVAGAMICALGLLSVNAQEASKVAKPQIKGGIDGHVKSVDPEKGTLSMITADGRERTFTITDDTTMLGPRGGKVRYGLKDRRFHEGMELTVVADGATARGRGGWTPPSRTGPTACTPCSPGGRSSAGSRCWPRSGPVFSTS